MKYFILNGSLELLYSFSTQCTCDEYLKETLHYLHDQNHLDLPVEEKLWCVDENGEMACVVLLAIADMQEELLNTREVEGYKMVDSHLLLLEPDLMELQKFEEKIYEDVY
ncbi:MAG: hypothetical protein ACRCX8_14360 [Sarcina sp.]